jgi:cell division protein FtsL
MLEVKQNEINQLGEKIESLKRENCDLKAETVELNNLVYFL